MFEMQTVTIKTNNRVCDQTNLTNFIGSQIYTSSTDNVLKAGVIQVGISDHYPVFITRKLNIKIKKHGHDKITYRSGKNFKPEIFKRDLMNFPWDTLKTQDNPVEYLEIWYNNYK